MKKKFLSILTAIAVAASLSACRADDTGQTPPLSEVVVSETMQSLETTVSSNETNSTEFDWSIDEVTSNLELNGIFFSLPCSLSELQQKFDETIDIADETIVLIDSGIECYESKLLFNDKELGTIYYTCNTNEVFGICLHPDCSKYTSFSLKNVEIGKTTKEQVYTEYGTPTRGEYESAMYVYLIEKRKDITFVFENDIVQSILINNISDYNKLMG